MTIEEQVRLYARALTVEEPDWSDGRLRRHDHATEPSTASAEIDEGPARIGTRSAWLIAAAALVIVVGAVGLLALRAGGEASPHPPMATPGPTVPLTRPASVYPASGDWTLVTWGSEPGADARWGYQLWVPDQAGRRWSMVVRSPHPADSSQEGEVLDLGGRSVLFGSDQSHPSATWVPVEGTTVNLLAPAGTVDRQDAVSSLAWILDGLEVGSDDALYQRVAAPLGDSLLTLGDQASALTQFMPHHGQQQQADSFTAVQTLYLPEAGWSVSLSITSSASEMAPPSDSVPVTIRGVAGHAATSRMVDGSITQLTWNERGHGYSLTFDGSIDTDVVLEAADRLRVAEPSEMRSLLLPNWLPILDLETYIVPSPTGPYPIPSDDAVDVRIHGTEDSGITYTYDTPTGASIQLSVYDLDLTGDSFVPYTEDVGGVVERNLDDLGRAVLGCTGTPSTFPESNGGAFLYVERDAVGIKLERRDPTTVTCAPGDQLDALTELLNGLRYVDQDSWRAYRGLPEFND